MNDHKGWFDGDVGRKIEARLLKATVEGDEFPISYALDAGAPIADVKEVKSGQSVNAQLLIDFLRSERPLDREIRNWIADMLDPTVVTNANLRLSARAGKRRASMLQYQYAVEEYLLRRKSGDGYDAAVADVVRRFGMTESLVKKAIARLEDGVKIHLETQRIQRLHGKPDSSVDAESLGIVPNL